jgi:class 3 adenylate cyclase
MRPKIIAPPHGNVTFIFTDLVGSSQIAKRLPYRDFEGKLLDPQFALFSRLITEHHGLECGTPAGDSVMAAFQSVHDALDCAVDMQKALPKITYTDPNGTPWTLTARIGGHRSVEEVIPTGNGLYLGHPEVNYAARIMAIAHAGQIVVSDSARLAAGTRHEVFQPFPNRRIKDGADKPETVHELRYDSKERAEPGTQFVPGWFREQNHYVARPVLENRIANLFARRTGNQNPYRLVTLHGFGGMGKTRLAMQCCLNATSHRPESP